MDTYLEGITQILTIYEFDDYCINDILDTLRVNRMMVHDTPPQVSVLSFKYLHHFQLFLLKNQ